MSGYLIPTKTGPKGPFTVDQIRRLSEAGKIPPGFHLQDAESGLMVTVEEVLAPLLPDLGGEDLDGAAALDAAPAPPPPPPRRVAPGGPVRGGPVKKALGLRGGLRSLGRGRGPAIRSTRGRTAYPASSPMHGAAVRHATTKSKTPIGILIAVGLFLSFAIPAFFWAFTAKLEGTWVLDEKEYAAFLEREAVRRGQPVEDAVKRAFLAALAKKLAASLIVEIDETSATFTNTAAPEGAPDRVRRYARKSIDPNRCDLIGTRPDGKPDIWGVDLTGPHLFLTTQDAKGVKTMLVLRRP